MVFLIAASSAWLAQWLHCLEASAFNDLSNLVKMMRVAMTIFLGSAALSSCHPVPADEKAVVLMLMVCDLNPVLALTGPADWALISNFGVMWANTLLELWEAGRNAPPKLRMILTIGWSILMLFTTLGLYAVWGLMGSFEQLLV